MKSKFGILLICFTVIALVFSLILPQLIFNLQIKSENTNVQTNKIDAMEFASKEESGFVKALKVYSGSSSAVPLTQGENYTEETIIKIVLEAIDLIYIDAKGLIQENITPLLIYSASGEESAVIWECHFETEDNESSVSAVIDDSTGKFLNLAVSYTSVTDKLMIKSSETWNTVLKQMYNLNSIDEMDVEDSHVSDGSSFYNYRCSIEGEEAFDVQVGIRDILENSFETEASSVPYQSSSFYILPRPSEESINTTNSVIVD